MTSEDKIYNKKIVMEMIDMVHSQNNVVIVLITGKMEGNKMVSSSGFAAVPPLGSEDARGVIQIVATSRPNPEGDVAYVTIVK